MGNLFSREPTWPDEVFEIDCPRQKVFENVFSPESITDWLYEELEDVEAVRDGEIAPGLLFKLKTENATAYIEFLRKELDDNGIGEKIRWRFYWVGQGPPLHDVTSPASKPAHQWVKENASMSYTAQFHLSDAPTPGRTKVIRETYDFVHSPSIRFFWASHPVVVRPDHRRMKEAAEKKWKFMPLPSETASDVGKPWPWHTVE